MLNKHKVYLAEDDDDDAETFGEAIANVSESLIFSRFVNGVHLMNHLLKELPGKGVVFLDINMPQKNGLECLMEIRHSELLRLMPVIIFSTTAAPPIINRVFELGADFFVQKPNNFNSWISIIHTVLMTDWKLHNTLRAKETFLIKNKDL